MGVFITFEGIDGTGKTDHAKTLAEELISQGHSVVLTAEPTKGKFGVAAKELILKGDASLPELKELFRQDREEHLKEVIYPALEQDKIVICDRYVHSMLAYQGSLAHNSEQRDVLAPDISFLLTCPPAVALARVRNRRKKIENHEKLSFLMDVNARYLAIFYKLPYGVIVDTLPPHAVVSKIISLTAHEIISAHSRELYQKS